MDSFSQAMHTRKTSYTPWILVGIASLVLVAAGIFIGQKIGAPTTLADQTITNTPQIHLDKTFSFPVTDTQGQQVTSIAYTIISANKQNQVIIKGQRASTIAGRSFFILNLKLTNTSSQSIELNSKDYIRVSVGGNSELLAADLHNDPIIIQPISTEYTKLGFPIDASQKHFVLHVGQLNNAKTEIPINFK